MLVKIKASHLVLFILVGALFTSCSPTRKLPEGTYLLKANTVYIDSSSTLDADDLEGIIKQRPNKDITLPLYVPGRVWGWDITLLRLNLRAYNLGGRDQSRLGNWLRLKVGEAPVVYEPALAENSRQQIKEAVFQSGYFNATVDTVPLYRVKKKMVKMAYIVHPGIPYTIKAIIPKIENAELLSLYTEALPKSILKEGAIYSYDDLESERARLIAVFKNNGYYAFTRDNIRFDLDSALGTREILLYPTIKNATVTIDGQAQTKQFIKFKPRYFYIYPQYDIFSPKSYRDTLYNDNIRIVYNKKLGINPRLLYHNILFRNDYYNQFWVDQTYKSFNSLDLFKNITIEHRQASTNINNDLLDAYIFLSPAKRNSYTVEARVETRANNNSNTSTNYNFGVSGNLSFQRRNAFKNGELLKLSLSGGLEPFFLSDSSSSKSFFNTTEFGPSISITFPRFLLPVNQDKFAKSARAKTVIAANYNTLRNEDIVRKSLRLNFGYEWNETNNKRHVLNPAEISLVNAKLSDYLDARLDQIGSVFLRNTYSSQIILASSYSFIYSNQYNPKSQKAYYNRSKIEGAGNLVRALSPSLNLKKVDDSYQIFGTNFAQYFKLENEFKTYRKSIFNNIVAFRLFTAFAKPLANNASLPFEKSYFAGGSNGIRAWGARSLGPGAYLDTTNFNGFLNRIGEIQLESNIEYRLQPIDFFFTKLEFALFVDVGNIWVFKEQGDRKNTEFSKDFYKQLALGGGVGARLDFDFILLRFDFGFPLHDPSLPGGERWFYQNKDEYNAIIERYNERNSTLSPAKSYRFKPNFNVGVGYPF